MFINVRLDTIEAYRCDRKDNDDRKIPAAAIAS